jgi:hypothetical protein
MLIYPHNSSSFLHPYIHLSKNQSIQLFIQSTSIYPLIDISIQLAVTHPSLNLSNTSTPVSPDAIIHPPVRSFTPSTSEYLCPNISTNFKSLRHTSIHLLTYRRTHPIIHPSPSVYPPDNNTIHPVHLTSIYSFVNIPTHPATPNSRVNLRSVMQVIWT